MMLQTKYHGIPNIKAFWLVVYTQTLRHDILFLSTKSISVTEAIAAV